MRAHSLNPERHAGADGTRRLLAAVACVGVVALGVRLDAIATPARAAPTDCPPGLSPEACAPPGAVAGLFALGEPLPGGTAVERVADPASLGLPPPPRGQFYARVHGDLLLVAERNRRVVASVAHLGTR